MVGVVGLDTLRLRFPLGRPTWCQVRLANGATAGGEGDRGWVEASVARLAHGNNAVPLDFSDLGQITKELVDACSAVLPAAVTGADLDLIDISRIDVVRDFHGIEDPGFIFTGMTTGRVPGGAVSKIYCERRKTTVTGVSVGPRRRWVARLYDKHAEAPLHAASGHVRFEVQLRHQRLQSPWAARHGGLVATLADVQEVTMENLAEATFHHVGFDAVVIPAEEIAIRVAKITGLSPATRSRLIGYCVQVAAGVAPGLSDKTERKYALLVREHGLLLGLGTGTHATLLHWASGTAVPG